MQVINNAEIVGASTSMVSTPRRPTCLLVLGMHRSGTSALARLLGYLGADLPLHAMGMGTGNERGHWEPERLVYLHDEMLEELSSRWDDWRSLDLSRLRHPRLSSYKEQINLILDCEYRDSDLFVLKDPRICRFTPLIVDCLHNRGVEVRILFINRNPLEVADSLLRRDRMGRVRAGLLWLRHVLDAELATRKIGRVVVAYDSLLSDWSTVMSRAQSDLALTWPIPIPDASGPIDRFLEPMQRHHLYGVADVNLDPSMRGWISDAYSALLMLEKQPSSTAAFAILDRVRSEFNRCEATLYCCYEEANEERQTELDLLKQEFGAQKEICNTVSAQLGERDRALSHADAGLAGLQQQLEQLNAEKLVLVKSLEEERSIRSQFDEAEKSRLELESRLEEKAGALYRLQSQLELETNARIELDERLRSSVEEVSATRCRLEAEIEVNVATRENVEVAMLLAQNAVVEANEKKLEVSELCERFEAAELLVGQLRERLIESESRIVLKTNELQLMAARTNEFSNKKIEIEEYANRLLAQNEALNTLNHSYFEQSKTSKLELQSIRASRSWRFTRPMRGLKRAATEKDFVLTLVRGGARSLFYRLPLTPSLRQRCLKLYGRQRKRGGLLRTEPGGVTAANLLGQFHSESPSGSLAPMNLPADGRWSLEYFKDNQLYVRNLAKMLAMGPPEAPTHLKSEAEHLSVGPLVTLIVRTYAGRWPLTQIALQSIFAQRYEPIEVFVVEDGSSTYAESIASLNTSDRCQFKHVPIAKAGRSAAANAGLNLARGEFIGFLDDDDYLLPDHCSLLVSHLHPPVDAAYAASLEIGATLNRKTMAYENKDAGVVYFDLLASSGQLINRNYFPIQCVLFRRSAMGDGDRFDQNLDALEDWLFWMRLLVGREVAPVAEVTSSFHVPNRAKDKAARVETHLAAEPYFDIQRSAFYEERRLTDTWLVNEAANFRMNWAIERALNVSKVQGCYTHSEGSKSTRLMQVLGHDPAPALRPLNKKIVAFTSINLRYLPKALAWAESVKMQNPDWETHILLNDALPNGSVEWPNVDVVYPICRLMVPGFGSWSFGLSVVELCTATKPFYARELLKAGYEYVFYFDPDIYIYSDLTVLVNSFGDSEVLLTPHCSQEAVSDSEIHFNEVSSLAHGVFNLGFIGFRNRSTAQRVVEFWCRRMLRHCIDDHARGLFTDQKWFNLVPVFFDKVKCLKHRGCNVASWNIASRRISLSGDKWFAGGEPLVFFHFSGYDQNVPRSMFDIFGSFTADLARLIENYDRANHQHARAFPECNEEWALARYENGEIILIEHRQLYRTKFELQIAFRAPYSTFGGRNYYRYVVELGSEGIEKCIHPPGFLRRYY